MTPANPLPIEPLPLGQAEAGTGGTDAASGQSAPTATEPVSPQELNAWRRGFTPQAEIWNGRLAMLGLSVGLSVLLVVRLAGG
jgi:hypothetical protein